MARKLKILLNLFTSDIEEKDFGKYSKLYEYEGYEVFNFCFSVDEYYLDMIDTVLAYLISEHGVSPYESKIVLQSNIINLTNAWYRLYNDVIDDFVFVDQHIATYQPKDSMEGAFTKRLSSFSGIENDVGHGRLYYRYNHPIKIKLLESFMESYQYDLLKPFVELDFQTIKHKEKIEKSYVFKGWTYKRATAMGKVDMLIDLNKEIDFENTIKVNEITQPSGYFFTLQYILCLSIPDNQKARAAIELNKQMNEEDKIKITEYVYDYLTVAQKELPFKQVINLYSFLTMLGTDKTIVKQMLKYIKEDSSQMDDHYAPFTNSLFYMSQANQEPYETYFRDRVEIASKLKEHYKPNEKVKAQRLDNHLVIVTGQLLSYNHAPTKVAIDYANNLKKFNPKLKVKIVVEDMFNYSPNELFFIYPFASADSKTVSKEHKGLLHSSIEVHYSDCRLTRKSRLQDDIKAITDFKPQWIFKIGAPDSLAVDQLYDYYPISSMSMGGAEYSEFVHMPFGGRSDKEVKEEREQKGISNEGYKYEQHIPGFEFSKCQNKFKRDQHGLKLDDFIIVTVGNRLASEIDEVFAEGMKQLLKEYSNIKWLIIGIEQHELISVKFQDILDQVKFISYAENLIDVYAICDVYANPFRQGGGISVAMAADAGLPVANIIGSNDANVYVPKGKAKTMENYFSYIEDLFTDMEYLRSEGAVFQLEFKKEFGFEQAATHIIGLLQSSEEYYKITQRNYGSSR